jgi:hypothetical protein
MLCLVPKLWFMNMLFVRTRLNCGFRLSYLRDFQIASSFQICSKKIQNENLQTLSHRFEMHFVTIYLFLVKSNFLLLYGQECPFKGCPYRRT